jgi:hypothetical protein
MSRSRGWRSAASRAAYRPPTARAVRPPRCSSSTTACADHRLPGSPGRPDDGGRFPSGRASTRRVPARQRVLEDPRRPARPQHRIEAEVAARERAGRQWTGERRQAGAGPGARPRLRRPCAGCRRRAARRRRRPVPEQRAHLRPGGGPVRRADAESPRGLRARAMRARGHSHHRLVRPGATPRWPPRCGRDRRSCTTARARSSSSGRLGPRAAALLALLGIAASRDRPIAVAGARSSAAGRCGSPRRPRPSPRTCPRRSWPSPSSAAGGWASPRPPPCHRDVQLQRRLSQPLDRGQRAQRRLPDRPAPALPVLFVCEDNGRASA